MSDSAAERAAFVERIRLQLRSRYREMSVEPVVDRFAVHVRGHGVDTVLPLSPLHRSVLRDLARAPVLISEFIAGVGHQLTPRSATTVHDTRLLWCVRAARYLDGLSRAQDLATLQLPGDLIAFVAEELPGSIMRGVPRDEWEAAGMDDRSVRAAASANTERRFDGLGKRIAAAERVPHDGWRMSADTLFQSSVVLAPRLLTAFVERAGGDVLLGVPDRGIALAARAASAADRGFAQRVTREFREAMNPVSPVVLRSDGSSLREELRGRRSRAAVAVMPWLQD